MSKTFLTRFRANSSSTEARRARLSMPQILFSSSYPVLTNGDSLEVTEYVGRSGGGVCEQMTRSEIESAIALSWSIDTTYCVDDYAAKDPAWGNCAVTALLLQQLLGGELMQGWAREPGRRGTAHYWNRVNGSDVDMTWRQFAPGTILTDDRIVDYGVLVENQWMRDRYENLLAAFCDRMNRVAQNREKRALPSPERSADSTAIA